MIQENLVAVHGALLISIFALLIAVVVWCIMFLVKSIVGHIATTAIVRWWRRRRHK